MCFVLHFTALSQFHYCYTIYGYFCYLTLSHVAPVSERPAKHRDHRARLTLHSFRNLALSYIVDSLANRSFAIDTLYVESIQIYRMHRFPSGVTSLLPMTSCTFNPTNRGFMKLRPAQYKYTDSGSVAAVRRRRHLISAHNGGDYTAPYRRFSFKLLNLIKLNQDKKRKQVQKKLLRGRWMRNVQLEHVTMHVLNRYL